MKTLTELRQFMERAMSLTELRTLSFDIGLDFENLSGSNKSEKIVELIKNAHRRRKMADMLELMAEEFSEFTEVNWGEAIQVIRALQNYDVAASEFEGEARLPPPFSAPLPLPHFIPRNEYDRLVKAITEDRAEIVRSHGLIGTGKSALAVQLAHDLRESFTDGVVWIRGSDEELEGDLHKTAAAYGGEAQYSQLPDLKSKVEYIQRLLADKNALVVLDGLVSEELFQELLFEDRRFQTIITTRDQMLLKEMAQADIQVSAFSQEESLAYLKEALGAERVEPEEEEALKLHRILGGLPLALGIVSGMLSESQELTIGEYNQLLADEETRIEGFTDWLDGRNAIAASFELTFQTLSPPLQKLFSSLGGFSGATFSSAAVAAVSEMIVPQVKMGLGRLSRLSLVNYNAAVELYEINPLLRVYALKKAGDQLDTYQERAVGYYMGLCRTIDKADHLQEIKHCWDSVLGTAQWLKENGRLSECAEIALHLTNFELGVMGFLEHEGLWYDARRLLGMVLQDKEGLELPSTDICRLHLAAAGFAQLQNDGVVFERELSAAGEILRGLSPSAEWGRLIAHDADLRGRAALQRDVKEAIDIVQKAQTALQAVADPQVDRWRGFLWGRLTGFFGRASRFEEAAAAAEQALTLLPDRPSSILIEVNSFLGRIHTISGNLPEGVARLERASQMAEEINALHRLPNLWNNMAELKRQLNEPRESLTLYTKARSLSRRLGDGFHAAGSTLNIGQVYIRLGEDLLALKMLEEALVLAVQQQFPLIECLALSNLVDLQLESDLTEQVAARLDRAEEIAEQIDLPYIRPTLLRQRAQLFLSEKQLAPASKLATRAITLAQELQDKQEEGIAWRVQGEVLQAAEQTNKAVAAFRKSEEILRDVDPYERARTLVALVQSYPERESNTERLQQILVRARQVFEATQAQRDLSVVDGLLGQWK